MFTVPVKFCGGQQKNPKKPKENPKKRKSHKTLPQHRRKDARRRIWDFWAISCWRTKFV